MNTLEILKFNLQEEKFPFFTDTQLQHLLDSNSNDIKAATYEGAILKAQDDSLSLGKINIPSNKAYWLTLARKYRPTKDIRLTRADRRDDYRC
jgi:hypothetical protein